ncbi:hypothetical protein ACFLUU_04260 [Chloroflexota bacterium]
MTTWVMIIAGINLLIGTFKLFGEPRTIIGSTFVLTLGYMVWYVFYGILLLSLGILAWLFVNRKDTRATVFNKKSGVISTRILAVAVIFLTLYADINVIQKFGTTITMTPTGLVLNIVLDLVSVALSFLTLRKAEKFRRLQKTQK